MNAAACTNEDDDELKSWHAWIGSRVCISGTKLGTLRYFGKTHFAEGSWCGVELDEAVGKNNGTVKDVRYFTCKANFGIFAPLSKTEKITDVSHRILPPVSNKSKLPQSKSKLKFAPLQSELPKTLNETVCLNNTKSHLPYQSNANDAKININEVYKKHRTSESFLEKKSECDFYRFNNNNNSPLDLGHLKIAERKTSTPVASPFKKHPSEQMIDFLNKTVTLDNNGKISYSNQESFAVVPDNCVLNTTFDLSKFHLLDNDVGRKENTFVFENANMFSTDYPKRPSEDCIDSEEDPKSSELEESLGILSLSQMKDFTLSFDNNSGTAIQVSPKIRKMESCDDVNEIPEFEENKISQELPGGSHNMLINMGSENVLKKIINPVVQTFELLNVVTLDKNNIVDQDDNTKSEVEHFNSQDIENLTPKESSAVKDSFIEFHSLDNVNLNVSPSATSTPTFTPLKFSKVPLPKPVKCNSISSSVHSPFTEQAVCLTPLNQTFNGDFFEQNLPMPKTNVISKPSNDVDQVNVKVSDAETRGFKLDNFESELSASCKFIANALSHETNTSTKDIIANITLDTSSSNLENKQPVLSKTKVLSNLIPFDDEREVSSKSSNSEILEKKRKVNSFCSEIISDSKSISDIVEDDILTSEIASNKNEATRVGELQDTDVKDSNHVKNAVCPKTNSVLHITSCNADNAVTVPSDIEARSLQFNAVPNSTSIRDELINATTHTVISEIPVDLHLEETEEIIDACDSQLSPADEINSVASNDSILIENKSECLTASSREKGVSELEDENTNKLSETFSCSTLKELDNFETACNEFHTEQSDVERRVLDVTMTVMQMDNLNVTVNIDQLNQTSNATYNKSDSVHSKSNASNDGSSNECLLLDNPKKSDVKIVLPKAPQKNIISKIKSMLESDKNSTDANQENQKSKQCGMSQKKKGKWDSVTSKIAAGLTDNNKKVKKEITSRVNTNLNASRQTISKSPQPSSATKWSKSNVSRKSETGNKSNVTNNRKNSLDNKMIHEDSKSPPSVQKVTGEREKDSRILVQLQNMDCEKKHSKTTKVNLKKGFGLFSKTTAVSRSNSLSSDCSQSSPASKNVLVPKTSMPVQTKALNGSKKTPVTPKIDAGSNKRAISGKNNKELPTHRPQTTSKFISKSSLVNEVKFLRNLCETRKKEIDMLEFVFQRAHLGFNALIVLLKHIIEHYDPFSQKYLANAHENMKAELQKTVERLFSCQKQLESIEKNSIVEVGELAEKLCCLHLSDMNDLKLKHSGMLKQMDLQHKKEIRILKENFQREAVRQKENYEEVGNMLKENHKKQMCELEERYQVELTELKQKYEDTEESLNEKISQLVSQCNSLREEFILMEEKLMRDKNKTIQAISAEKTKLQKDVESLHAVIEIKNIEIRKIKNKMIFLKEKENELYEAKKQIKIYESQIESLQVLVAEKNEKERKWELRCKETEELLRNQKTLTRDMLMNRDQVRYKLGLYMERNSADATYLSGNIMTANRSNSLDSLPVSKCKLSTATTNYQPKTGHSMSLSWHPHEPIHEEENSSKEHSASFMSSATTLQNESQLNKECNLSFLQKTPLKRPMNRSQWSSENIAHFYVRLDDGQFSITPSEDKKSEFVDCKLVKPIFITSKENEPKINDDNHSSINHSSLKSDVDLNADKSASGAISLQSSYTSDSSNSNFIVHPESEESSSCSQRSKDNNVKNTCEHMLYDDLDPLGVKNPRNLAGEAMIQDINTILPFSKQLKSDNREELSQMEDNFSSPEESKEKINNQVSIATPSLDTLSSQGMADSTNLDVSWGDEEILSD